jgi:hypothetical protein
MSSQVRAAAETRPPDRGRWITPTRPSGTDRLTHKTSVHDALRLTEDVELEAIVRRQLELLGEAPGRDGLLKTDRRWYASASGVA